MVKTEPAGARDMGLGIGRIPYFTGQLHTPYMPSPEPAVCLQPALQQEEATAMSSHH